MQLDEEGHEEGQQEDQPEVLLAGRPAGPQRPARQGPVRQPRPGGRQKTRQESPKDMSQEMSEFIAEMNLMAEDSGESGITDMEESETTISIRSAPLPQSIDSSEELSKLRPRIDARLCPSPG